MVGSVVLEEVDDDAAGFRAGEEVRDGLVPLILGKAFDGRYAEVVGFVEELNQFGALHSFGGELGAEGVLVEVGRLEAEVAAAEAEDVAGDVLGLLLDAHLAGGGAEGEAGVGDEVKGFQGVVAAVLPLGQPFGLGGGGGVLGGEGSG